MIKVVEAQTRLEAWLKAAKWLLDAGPTYNLLLDIASPGSDGPSAKAAYSAIDSFYAEEDVYPLHTVAETIFPGWEYKNRGIRGVFETYSKSEYPFVKKVNQWGTYAQRMLRRETPKGVINPLEVLIGKMRWALNQKSKFRSCYEISMGVPELEEIPEFELPLYRDETDARKHRQIPCMSHLSFKMFDDKVHAIAIYRSHDYRHKVVGNLLGLARLQACIAQEVGIGIGGMVIHSTYAWIEGGKGRFKRLLSDISQTIQQSEDNHKGK